ncbi:unnamed protein product [Closterium sp. NIES-53]
MALLRVQAFDHEGRPVAFDTWHDDLELYLLSDIEDSVSLFDNVSGVAPAPPATADDLAHTALDGEVGDASVFRVWGSRAFVRDTSADKLYARTIPCVFLGFVSDAPGWPFYHPISRRVLSSQDVTFDESVPFHCLFPYRSAPPPPPLLFLAPGPPPVDPLPPQGPAPSGVSQVDPLLGTAPVEVAVRSGAASGAASGGAEPGGAGSEGAGSGGAEPGGAGSGGAEPGGAEPESVEPGGAESEGAESGGAEPRGAASSGGPAGASPRLSSQQLHGWLVRRAHRRSGALGAGGARDTGVGGAAVTTGVGSTGGIVAAGPGGARTSGTGTAKTGGVGCAGAGDPTDLTVSRLLANAITDPSFESAAVSALIAELLDFAATCRLDYVTALVAESVAVSPPSVGGECALGTGVLEDRQEEFECLAAAEPRFPSMLLAPEGDPDAPDIPTPRSYAEAITGTYIDEVPPSRANIVNGMWIFRVKRPPGSPHAFKAHYVARGFSQRQGVDYFHTFSPTPKMTTLRVLLHVAAQRDYELHALDFSTAFLQGILHEEIWLRRPPGFTGTFPASTQWSLRWPVYGLRQAPREWHDTLRTTVAALGFAPSTADPSLFLRTDTSLPPFYVLVYVDNLVFAPGDTEALSLVKLELQKRHTCTDLCELRSSLRLQITRDRARRTITLPQSHMVHQVLQRFGFQFSSPLPTPLSTSHSLSAPPLDESVEPSGPYPELVGCLMYLMTMSGTGLVLGGRGPVVLAGHADTSWVDDSATQRLSQGHTFSLGSGSFSWWSTRSSSVLNSSCEAEIYYGAMAAQELRWVTYLLTDLEEQPRSPPQRGQLRLAYVATRANTADVFTKALPPACFAFLD